MSREKKGCYILDECIIRHAAALEDEKNDFSIESMKIITDIFYKCPQIILSKKILRKYESHFEIMRNKGITGVNTITKIFNEVMANCLKAKFCEDVDYELSEENCLPEDDIYLIRLAVANNATLITADNRLITKLNPDHNGQVEKYRFRVLNTQQALVEISRI